MIWILLLYVLPLVISIVGAYFMVKQDEGDVKDFLKIVPLMLIPLANIAAIIVEVCILTQDWLDNNDDWQNFLNKKL
jgi:hypothetical protein